MKARPLVALLPLAACETATEKEEPVQCSVVFAATVNSGPSVGTEMLGVLRFDVAPEGTLTGELIHEDKTTVPVTGSADNNAINLVFTLSETAIIYGVGTSDQPVAECTGTFGGPFTGPAAGDAGDWLARAFAVDGSTPSYNFSQ